MAATEIVCSLRGDDKDLDFSDDDLDAMNLEELKAFYKRRVQRDNKILEDLKQGAAILKKDTARLKKACDKKNKVISQTREDTEELRAHAEVLESALLASSEELKALSSKEVKIDKEVLAKLNEGTATLQKLTAGLSVPLDVHRKLQEAGVGKSEKEMSTALPMLKPCFGNLK